MVHNSKTFLGQRDIDTYPHMLFVNKRETLSLKPNVLYLSLSCDSTFLWTLFISKRNKRLPNRVRIICLCIYETYYITNEI